MNSVTEYKGRALIINILKKREGSEVDVYNMNLLLESMKYKVSIKQDLTAQVSFNFLLYSRRDGGCVTNECKLDCTS